VLHPVRALTLALSAFVLFAAGPQSMAAQGSGSTKPVVVFAAASLKTALDDLATEWQGETGRVARISYAGTPALARQIEQGAPADVFISADRDWMDYLARRALVREPRPLLANRLVLVAPVASTVELKLGPGAPLVAALGEGRLAVANVDSVPAGRYAKVALDSLGLWPQVAKRLVQSTDVRAALRLVARGEAPLGIVYATDAKAEPKVRIVDIFDQETHPTILYMMAAVAESSNPDGEAFLAFLRTASARRIFEREGFTVVASGRP
jgi:molybdate transport system substrate-binding protein